MVMKECYELCIDLHTCCMAVNVTAIVNGNVDLHTVPVGL
jgi:hypothetical protein